MVELATPFVATGNFVGGSGVNASLGLLTSIRNATNNPAWKLVPPLQTGPREAVAVYYDALNYAFTGPFQWPGGVGPSFDPSAPNPLPTASYPAPFNLALPNRSIPQGSRSNGGISERRVAAAWKFQYKANHFVQGNYNFNGMRVPYWVTFVELDNNQNPPTVLRELSLFVVHAPASTGPAQFYLRDLELLAEITDPAPNAQNPPAGVRVVLGDFNVNLLKPDMTRNGYYLSLANAGYTLGIDRPGAAPNPLAGYKGYFATHIKRGKNATYWSTNAVTDYYPGYGYIGSSLDSLPNFYSIDNILARYLGNNVGGPMANVTVLNGIVGSPYSIVNAPAGNPPVGVYRLPIYLAAGRPPPPPPRLFAPPPQQAPQFSAGRRGAFKGWDNFGRIRSTSDHLAIVADV